jgi:hypothetical protein
MTFRPIYLFVYVLRVHFRCWAGGDIPEALSGVGLIRRGYLT